MNILMDKLKYLILMALLGSISACTSQPPNQSASVTNSVSGPYDSANSLLFTAYNAGIDRHYRLTPLQKRKQTHAVYSALHAEYGQEFTWYEGNAMGVTKAVHGYPQGSGYCRVVYTTLKKDLRQRNFKDTACVESGHQGWRFVVK